jgi:uncharacterized protein (DUF111 family)
MEIVLRTCPSGIGTVDYEATTPTGAAILAACVKEYRDRHEFAILKTGYGIGTRDGAIPTSCGSYSSETAAPEHTEASSACLIECNIDDMNPELYDYVHGGVVLGRRAGCFS